MVVGRPKLFEFQNILTALTDPKFFECVFKKYQNMKYQSDKFQIRDKNLMIVLPRKEKKIVLNRSLNTVGKM